MHCLQETNGNEAEARGCVEAWQEVTLFLTSTCTPVLHSILNWVLTSILGSLCLSWAACFLHSRNLTGMLAVCCVPLPESVPGNEGCCALWCCTDQGILQEKSQAAYIQQGPLLCAVREDHQVLSAGNGRRAEGPGIVMRPPVSLHCASGGAELLQGALRAPAVFLSWPLLCSEAHTLILHSLKSVWVLPQGVQYPSIRRFLISRASSFGYL